MNDRPGPMPMRRIFHPGIDRSTAAQVVNRLREEKYIHEEQSQAKKGGKSRASAARNTGVKRGQLVVNKTLQQKRLKRDVYFSPGQGAELECLEADTIMTQVTGSLKVSQQWHAIRQHRL